MIELPLCGHRGELTAKGYLCDSPKLLPNPGYRSAEFCAEKCPYHDEAPKHESRAPLPEKPKPRKPCVHLGRRDRDTRGQVITRICKGCGGRPLDLFLCSLHGSVTLGDCLKCSDYIERRQSLSWSYGVMTVPERSELLKRTLDSLSCAGFTDPLVSVDGSRFKYGVVRHWMILAYELYLRDPWADRYVVFQDDILVVRNLMEFLEKTLYPEKGYLNCYTAQSNRGLGKGWKESRLCASNEPKYQVGRGALALVFNRPALMALFSSRDYLNKPYDRMRGHVSIDGAIVNAMNKAGWREYVHTPSLVWHTGQISTFPQDTEPRRRKIWPEDKNGVGFPGEEFDALSLLEQGIEQ